MKRKAIFIPVLALVVLSSCNFNDKAARDYPIRPVPFTRVKVNDRFWAPRILTNHRVTIPIAFRKSEETGRIDNFKIAGGLKEGNFCSHYPFDDSDVFKNIEAASYSLQLFPDPMLEAYLDTLISFIAAAQEADGYLYTNRTIDPANTHEMAGTERWQKEEDSSHELYNAGHLYEAAVAHFQATGNRSLLDVALRNADLIESSFGWGKIEKVPGHQEIEIGLVKLYRLTGEKKYLDLAKFFLDRRGPDGSEYNQMHRKVAEQDEAVGHAVRAQYMYSAMADVAALTGDSSYLRAINALWTDVTEGKTYLTGGIGSVGNHEGFGPAFNLPNMDAYCETCAAIANALWNYRMFLLHGDSRYFDVFEKVLYNGLLSGVSLSGDRFFYPNPLASDGQHQRREWFGCACCPVNITRFLPSLPGYIYAVSEEDLYVNLFIGNEAEAEIGGTKVTIVQETGYPWDGRVRVGINPDRPVHFRMHVRVPGWADNRAFVTGLYEFADPHSSQPEISINGEVIPTTIEDGYAVIGRRWMAQDEIVVTFPMDIRLVRAREEVIADSGRLALQRGPLIYCAEQTPADLWQADSVSLGIHSGLEYTWDSELMGGTGVITGTITGEYDAPGDPNSRFTAIPYFSWANRGPSVMRVWLRAAPY